MPLQEFPLALATTAAACSGDDLVPEIEHFQIENDAGQEVSLTVISEPVHDGDGGTVSAPLFVIYNNAWTQKTLCFAHIQA